MKINRIESLSFEIIYFSDNVGYIRTKKGEWYIYSGFSINLFCEFRVISDLEEELETLYQEFKKNKK